MHSDLQKVVFRWRPAIVFLQYKIKTLPYSSAAELSQLLCHALLESSPVENWGTIIWKCFDNVSTVIFYLENKNKSSQTWKNLPSSEFFFNTFLGDNAWRDNIWRAASFSFVDLPKQEIQHQVCTILVLQSCIISAIKPCK